MKISAADPISDRLTYAAFPSALKAAMKLAAARNGWCRATWAMQTALLQDSMQRGCYLPEELAEAYRNPPPGDRLLEAA